MQKYKAKVYVRLRAAVDDSAGNAVRAACGRLSDLSISKLRLGKLIEMDFEAENDDDANKEIKKLSSKFLANEVIEDYEFKVWSIDEVTK
jgi:phosphoribosylformylglycinamidine synthase PurS subunit|tara:strand:- start:747 stop:1016 length:270 start_codon:yes stop_codon:yes gene_type:complete